MTSQDNPDRALIQKAAKGDPMAFTELFNLYFQPVYNYAFSLSHDKAQADDLTQEAFIRAHNNLDKLGPPWNFRAWVFRLTRNLFIDLTRKSRSDQAMLERLPSSGGSPDPEKETLLREVAERVHLVLQRLTPQHREILSLRELHHFSYAEIASIMEISPTNVGVMLRRAREKFQQVYGVQLVLEAPAEGCTDAAALLSLLHDGEAPVDQVQFVREHLQECEACQERERSLAAVSYTIGLLLPVIPPLGLRERILNQTGTTQQIKKIQRRLQIKTYLIGGGIGGLLGVVFLGLAVVFGGLGGGAPSEDSAPTAEESIAPLPSFTPVETSTPTPTGAVLEPIEPSPTGTAATLTYPPTWTFTPSSLPPTVTFTPEPSGSIGGVIFQDMNANGSYQNGEPGISGVTAHLGYGACLSTGYQNTAAGVNGGFNFPNLPAGTYCLSVEIPLACNTYSSPTTPTQYTINLAPGAAVSRPFGYFTFPC